MCKAMRALETLQCSGKDTVYKKEHPLGMQTRGWVILSKLCAWCVGLVLKHGFLFHPGFSECFSMLSCLRAHLLLARNIDKSHQGQTCHDLKPASIAVGCYNSFWLQNTNTSSSWPALDGFL